MSMSMLLSARAELAIQPVLSIGGKLVCAACLEHGRESVLLIGRTRHCWWAICLSLGCRDGISRDRIMWRPVRGRKRWTDEEWKVGGKKLLPGEVAADFSVEIEGNGRELHWAGERLKGLLPPPAPQPKLGTNGKRTRGIRLGPRPKKQKHRHKNNHR